MGKERILFTDVNWLARMLHELLSGDHEDGYATGQPQSVGPETYLDGRPQGPTPEDVQKAGYIRGCSKRLMRSGLIGEQNCL